FSYYRMRGADKPPPAKLPDARLLEYADHPTSRGRAALAHLGRAVKDPALLPVCGKLAKDDDWEVRRAVALALADGAKTKRPAGDRETCLGLLGTLLGDKDAHVVASACRAMASFVPPTPSQVDHLLGAATHPDFNVRVAALEALG